jgi:hypothetical protein
MQPIMLFMTPVPIPETDETRRLFEDAFVATSLVA